ncbi:MAG: FMN-binding negative transcriptional regulator [Lautropia sp.]|nr:FMN-binding negative transcriptional regulator [Lautropia sp.]
MFIQRKHLITDPDEVFALIERYPLGSWVNRTSEGGLTANHIPFFLDRERGPHGTLMAHVARGNPVWKQLADGLPSVVMFRGVDAYITPAWYASHTTHGKAVPTWNYEAVNAHGVAHTVHDRDWLLMMLRRMTEVREAVNPKPWRMEDAPADYIDKLLRAIVGIEIPIERLEAKRKASQGEDMADRLGTIEGLRQLDTRNARQMADTIAKAIESDRPPPKYRRYGR